VNGFGRIGRAFVRAVRTSNLDVVAVNDVVDTETLAHLLACDSTLGAFPVPVTVDGTAMRAGDVKIETSREGDPSRLDWEALGVDIVIESTGRLRTRDAAGVHVERGAREVLISAPGKDVDFTTVDGVNHGEYDPATHHVVSAASCTGSQNLVDGPHKDPRRARAAAVSIIPTSTGAARTAGVVLPELSGRLDGMAVRRRRRV